MTDEKGGRLSNAAIAAMGGALASSMAMPFPASLMTRRPHVKKTPKPFKSHVRESVRAAWSMAKLETPPSRQRQRYLDRIKYKPEGLATIARRRHKAATS